MKEVIKLFKEIQNTSSLNDKKAIISANKDNELFKRCLAFLLNPNIITGLSDKKLNKEVEMTKHIDITCDFESIMDYLETNNSGRDSDISIVQGFIVSQPEEYREFYSQMVTKSFRLGADAKLINKCIPNLIPVFDVQLGTSIEKVKLNGNEWIAISKKLNGTRAAFIGDKIMTRQGKEYKGLDHIISDLHRLGLKNCFVDGELVYKNAEGLSDSDAFQKGTGIAMSKSEDKSELKLVVFDVFPLNEFWTGKSNNTYSKRMGTLLDIKEDIVTFGDIENVEIVPMCYEGIDHSEIWKWLDYAEENDWEGIILNLDTPYECKRTKNLIKVKKFFSCDIRCIGVEEGSGRNKGTLGALVCDYKGFKVRVGSGFSDADRKHFWSNPEDIVGHIVSVKYKEETSNKDGGVSIQFPVFETVRFDKDEPSYN